MKWNIWKEDWGIMISMVYDPLEKEEARQLHAEILLNAEAQGWFKI